jgi:alpha-L-fucosidase
MKMIGATSAVLTAKHGCGFLLWEPKSTLPDGSPYTYHTQIGDVLAEFVSVMTQNNIGYGFYFSLTNNFFLNAFGHNVKPPSTLLPGQASVTQAEFEALSLSLVSELWTDYGPLTEIWLDGGCGAMCDQVASRVRQLPNAAGAVAFNGGGVSDSPVRWCGTEGGSPSGWPTIWSTTACVPSWCAPGSGSGSPPNTTNATWYPSGVDMTIQEGDHWFFTPSASLHTVADLAVVYHHSVGANAHLELDFAVDRTGAIAPAHAALYASFGAWITGCYSTPIANGVIAAGQTSTVIAITGSSNVDRIAMKEDISGGQFVIDFKVEALFGGAWIPFSSGTTIGAKRIDVSAAGPALITSIRVTIISAFAPGHNGVSIDVFSGNGCATSEY